MYQREHFNRKFFLVHKVLTDNNENDIPGKIHAAINIPYLGFKLEYIMFIKRFLCNAEIKRRMGRHLFSLFYTTERLRCKVSLRRYYPAWGGENYVVSYLVSYGKMVGELLFSRLIFVYGLKPNLWRFG